MSQYLFTTQTPAGGFNGAATTQWGTRFETDVAGNILGGRIYHQGGGPQDYQLTLWSDAGAQLAQVDGTSQSGIGWFEMTFPAPVAITADTPYRISWTPVGSSTQVAYNSTLHSTQISNLNLRAADTGQRGVYREPGPGWPNQSADPEGYFCDPFFAPGGAAVAPTWDTQPVSHTMVAGPAFSYDYSQHVSGTPTPTYTLQAGSLAGTGLTLSSAGVLSGTPPNGGVTQNGIVIRATNSEGFADSNAHNITINYNTPAQVTGLNAVTP